MDLSGIKAVDGTWFLPAVGVVGQRARPGANMLAIVADNSQGLQIKDPGSIAREARYCSQFARIAGVAKVLDNWKRYLR
jgi:hypothetical protein